MGQGLGGWEKILVVVAQPGPWPGPRPELGPVPGPGPGPGPARAPARALALELTSKLLWVSLLTVGGGDRELVNCFCNCILLAGLAGCVGLAGLGWAGWAWLADND